MSQEGYLARLGIDTSDIDQAVSKVVSTIAELGETFNELRPATDRAERGLMQAAGAADKTATATRGAAKAAAEGSTKWQAYVKALQDANQEYRKFKQGQVTGEGGGVPTSSLSASERRDFLNTADAQSASLVSQLRKEEKAAGDTAEMWQRLALARSKDQQGDRLDNANQKAAASEAAAKASLEQARANDDLATAGRRLESVQRDRAQVEAAEANRQMEIRAALVMRARAEEEVARAAAASAAAQRNSLSASAFRAGGIDSRLGQEPTGLRARDTSYAAIMQAEERRAASLSQMNAQRNTAEVGKLRAAQDALAASITGVVAAQQRYNAAQAGSDLQEQARAANALADAQEAQTASARAVTQAQEQNFATLARTRYALYDVSQMSAVAGTAMLATTAAIAGAGVVYEREFANVRRTVGVTGQAADDLYGQFLRLSTQIPTSFGDLSQIGTLAGQLGVAEDRVASFTRTTAMFSATTDVTVDSAATAFGRLDALLGDVEGRYDRLGSAVLNVGVNSVATESEILGITNQIAAAAQQSGLAASEVVGLSGALASLGIKPEAARGTILRVFSSINSAIAEGGEALDKYGRISGMTADEFRRGWSTDFTGTFLAFLDGAQSSAAGAESTIRDLGITATRDVNALLRLAQNTDVLASTLDLAAEGFDNTNILADNFNVIATTNAAKLQILGQTVGAFFATLGNGASGPLSDFLDYLQRTTEGLIRFAETPVGQFLGITTIALTAVGGVLALVTAATLRTAGGWLALKQAMGAATAQSWLAAGGIRATGAQLLGAAGAAGVFAGALKATGIGLLITGGLWLLSTAIDAVTGSMRSGKQVAEDYFGSLDGISAAMSADNPVIAARAAALRGSTESTQQAAASLDELILSMANHRVQMDEQQAAIAAGNAAIDTQALHLGENTRAWITNALMQSEAFRQMFENSQQIQALMGDSSFTAGGITVEHEAFSMEALTAAATAGGTEGAQAYVDSWVLGLAQAFQAAGVQGNVMPLVQEALGGSEVLTAMQNAGIAVGEAWNEGAMLTLAGDVAGQLVGDFDAASTAADDLAGSLGAVEGEAWNSSSAISSIIDQAYGADNAARTLSNSMYQLGQDFATNGANVAVSGQAMQQTIENIIASSGNSGVAAARLQGFFNMLVEGGYASAAQLAQLQGVIAGLLGGRAMTVPVPKFNPAPLIAGMNKVRRAATGGGGGGGSKPKKGGGGGAAGAIRTLVDYAGDLQKVFSRSFDIRFGSVKAMDGITSSWRKMREETEKAGEAVAEATQDMTAALREYQTTSAGLLADRAIAEHWLSIAEAYDDALRAGELRAELVDIDNELAKAAEENAKAQQSGAEAITEAQKDLDKGLTGNGEAAIENRAKLMELVSSYQSYVAELASSGMSQEDLRRKAAELKAEFLRQAAQLGYNSRELDVYAAAFDDVTIAINKVPRNITVAANANPAIQALNEAVAQMRRTASGGVDIPVRTGGISGVDSLAANFQAMFKDKFEAWMRQRPIAIEGYMVNGSQVYRVPGTGLKLFKSGGWTGNGDPNKIAGLTHGREFVLNQTGAQMFPREMLEAANRGQAVSAPVTTVSSPSRATGPQVVELSPYDRMLLARAGDVQFEIKAGTIAGAVGANSITAANRGSA